jgi:hypothetical protein
MAENNHSASRNFGVKWLSQCKNLLNPGRLREIPEKMPSAGNLARLLLLRDLTDAGALELIGPWRFLNEK